MTEKAKRRPRECGPSVKVGRGGRGLDLARREVFASGEGAPAKDSEGCAVSTAVLRASLILPRRAVHGASLKRTYRLSACAAARPRRVRSGTTRAGRRRRPSTTWAAPPERKISAEGRRRAAYSARTA